MTELYDEHIEWRQDGLQLNRLVDMTARDLRPDVNDVQIVPSDSGNGAYVVAEISVLDKPFEIADVSTDRITTHVCSCSDFYFNQSNQIDVDMKPSKMGTCKHIRAAYKSIKAEHDDNQQTL